MTNEELLAKAKRDYPIGTRYYYVEGNNRDISTITGNLQWDFKDNKIYGVNWNKNGNPTINDCIVYKNGEWAKIISKPNRIIQIY